MLAFVMASMMVAGSDPAPVEAASMKGMPTRYCREIGSAASRSQAVVVCRTRTQWQRWESCQNVTRYCAPKKRVASAAGPGTAFPLNEDSRVVCRMVKVTGSRLTSQNTCLPLREWQRMWDESRATMSVLQDRHSTPVCVVEKSC